MTPLRWIFLALFAYGLSVGLYGAAILSLIMWAFLCYATGVFEAQDAAWMAHPKNAKAPTCTARKLDEHCCSCSGDKM